MRGIMDCQMCEGPALARQCVGRPRVFTVEVSCQCCGIIGRPSITPNYEEEGGADDAIAHWNHMQSLIARGKLLDEAPKTTTKGRL